MVVETGNPILRLIDTDLIFFHVNIDLVLIGNEISIC